MIDIRKASKDDVEKICDFMAEVAKVSFPGSAFNRNLFRQLLVPIVEKAPERVRVVEADRDVVGYIQFKAMRSTVGDFGLIEHVFVDPSQRGKGLAKRLVQSAEEYFRGKGLKLAKLSVTKTNHYALSLYESLGYEVKRHKMEKNL